MAERATLDLMKMGGRSADVGSDLVPRARHQWDVGASGTLNWCCEHEAQTLRREAPPGDGRVVAERRGDGTDHRAVRRPGRPQGLGHRLRAGGPGKPGSATR